MNPHEMRLGRLFHQATGRGFVVAFDRGLGASVVPGGEDALGVVEAVANSPVEGVLLSPGLAARSLSLFAHSGSPSLLVRSDLLVMNGTIPAGLVGDAEEYRLLIQPEQAVALGADVVVLFLVLGYQDDKITANNAQIVAQTVQRAHAVGLPVMVETVLWGSRVLDQRDPDRLAFACRFCAELGADVIKTQYTGDVESMRDLIATVPVPVMVLGGPRSDSAEDMSTTTREILHVGARGVVYGRNIWQSDNPAKAAALVAEVVHDDTDRT